MSMQSPTPSPETVARQKPSRRTCKKPMAGHRKHACSPPLQTPEPPNIVPPRTPSPSPSEGFLDDSCSDTSSHSLGLPRVVRTDVGDRQDILRDTGRSLQNTSIHHQEISGFRPRRGSIDISESPMSPMSYLHRVCGISPLAVIYDSRDLTYGDICRFEESRYWHTVGFYTPTKEYSVMSEDREVVQRIARVNAFPDNAVPRGANIVTRATIVTIFRIVLVGAFVGALSGAIAGVFPGSFAGWLTRAFAGADVGMLVGALGAYLTWLMMVAHFGWVLVTKPWGVYQGAKIVTIFHIVLVAFVGALSGAFVGVYAGSFTRAFAGAFFGMLVGAAGAYQMQMMLAVHYGRVLEFVRRKEGM